MIPPIDKMKSDAARVIKRADEFPDGCSSLHADLACHVLALIEEVERLTAENSGLLKACEFHKETIAMLEAGITKMLP